MSADGEVQGCRDRDAFTSPADVIGLDLSQASEPTGLAVLRRSPTLAGDAPAGDRWGGRDARRYDVVHLERLAFGTPYPRDVEMLSALIARPELAVPADRPSGRPRIALGATGVGSAVVDLFLEARPPAEVNPVTIIAGEGHRRDSWEGGGRSPSGWPGRSWSGSCRRGCRRPG